MKKRVILALMFCILSARPVWANTEPKDDDLKIVVTSLEITDKALKMTYEIINNSKQEIWICAGGYLHFQSAFGMHARADICEDGHTLTIGLSFSSTEDTKTFCGPPGCIRFIRLEPGENQKESIFTEMPIYLSPQSDDIKRQSQATHLAFKIDYYKGNLPEYYFRVLEYNEKIQPIDSNYCVLTNFYSWINECLISREDELLIRDELEFEKIAEFHTLRTIVDNVQIPYEEVSIRHLDYEKQDFTSCTKVEIKYQPSMLEYFFPYAFQKNLLSSEELKYLQSEKTLILENTKEKKLLSYDINMAGPGCAFYGALIERYRSSVNIVCHYNYKPPLSCVIYNDDTIKIDSDIIHCTDGFPCLKKFTPQIEDLDLRIKCAANLKNQWYRFRYYNYDEAKRIKDVSLRDHKIYPKPSQWCDDIGPIYKDRNLWWEKFRVCPSAGRGKCHYAMNPNCEPDSPGDMVLLFETKAGWNQNGGPELFTFDNHDPKGGCVLLNDGTVKFIRTEQELNALRWK